MSALIPRDREIRFTIRATGHYDVLFTVYPGEGIEDVTREVKAKMEEKTRNRLWASYDVTTYQGEGHFRTLFKIASSNIEGSSR